jgi:hypothetical protein
MNFEILRFRNSGILRKSQNRQIQKSEIASYFLPHYIKLLIYFYDHLIHVIMHQLIITAEGFPAYPLSFYSDRIQVSSPSRCGPPYHQYFAASCRR